MNFNDQYPTMEEIERKRQEEVNYENNRLLKEQKELIRQILEK